MNFYKDKRVIPCYVFEWGWETFIDLNLLEKQINKNQTYLVIQDNHFDLLSSSYNQQKIKNCDIGNTKIFLQFNRNAEINGEEFNQEEIDFAKIIIGKVVNITTLKNERSIITKTFSNYHHLTPVYLVEVIDIFHFKEFLFNSTISKLDDFQIDGKSVFDFNKLENFYGSAQVDSNLLNDNCIFIRAVLSEYSFQHYLVVKKMIDNKYIFFIKFFTDFYCGTEKYFLVDYQLNQNEIKLLSANNFMCLRFFMQ